MSIHLLNQKKPTTISQPPTFSMIGIRIRPCLYNQGSTPWCCQIHAKVLQGSLSRCRRCRHLLCAFFHWQQGTRQCKRPFVQQRQFPCQDHLIVHCQLGEGGYMLDDYSLLQADSALSN